MGCNGVAWSIGRGRCNGVVWIYGQLVGVSLSWVYVHLVICETSSMQQCSMDLWSIVGSICQGYMCMLLYVNLLGVMVLHTSMLDWRRGVGSVYHGYICILLYV